MIQKPTQIRPRNSSVTLNKVYFWTDTIKDWKQLLRHDKYKNLVLDSLSYLTKENCIKVYAFVIMPNHLHLVWQFTKMNGAEMPHASFNKFVSHHVLKDLKSFNSKALAAYAVNESTRKHRFWQRDALAIELDYESKAIQKINYIHNNPLQTRWNIVKIPTDYYWSSAHFYKTGIDRFGFLFHIKDEFE